MNPGSETFSKIDLQPPRNNRYNAMWLSFTLSPDKGTELFLLVGVEFGQLALAGLELLLVIGEIPHVKPVFSRFLLELVNNFLEASDRH